jgi:hypothetical protein
MMIRRSTLLALVAMSLFVGPFFLVTAEAQNLSGSKNAPENKMAAVSVPWHPPAREIHHEINPAEISAYPPAPSPKSMSGHLAVTQPTSGSHFSGIPAN